MMKEINYIKAVEKIQNKRAQKEEDKSFKKYTEEIEKVSEEIVESKKFNIQASISELETLIKQSSEDRKKEKIAKILEDAKNLI